MSMILDILSGLCLGLGAFFYLVGAIGLYRMPDLFTRMHAVSVSDTLGAALLILGMLIIEGPTLVAFKLVMIMLVLLFSSTVATHALARAALHDGNRPLLAQKDGTLAPTDPVDLFPELGPRLATPLRSESVEEAMAALPAPGTGTRIAVPEGKG